MATPCDISFYKELIEEKKTVNVYLKNKLQHTGVILEEGERAIIMEDTNELTKGKRRMIYKGAIVEIEES